MSNGVADDKMRQRMRLVVPHLRRALLVGVLLAIVEVGGVPETAEILGIADSTVTAHGSIDAHFLSSLSVKLPELGVPESHFVGQQSVCGGNVFPCPPGHVVSQLDGTFSDSFDLSAIPLSSFTGSDPLDFFLATFISVEAECTAGHDCSLSTMLPWGGTVTVAYDYTPIGGGEPPTSVPEPAPLALPATRMVVHK